MPENGAVSIITLNIGKAILEGTNTYTGKTTVGNGSTLQIGNNSATGNLGGGGVEVDGTLTFNRSTPLTVVNSLSGAGTVIQGGAGALIITGGNTGFTGGFLVGLGSTLQVGAGGAAGDLGSAAVTNNGSLVFNRSDTFVTGNSLSGIGSLTQAGSGTLSLTTTPGYSGGTISIGRPSDRRRSHAGRRILLRLQRCLSGIFLDRQSDVFRRHQRRRRAY